MATGGLISQREACGTSAMRQVLPIAALLLATNVASSAEGSPGITVPTVLQPFVPTAPRCSKPADLKPILAFAKDNKREFIEGVDHGLAQAAKDNHLEYRVAPRRQ
ncbi:mlr8058 [Mesorhizobium japonicum MAFF 303099]|uniref:Mlr8058 protein n=2 Tax=Mesorhizobium japonicum TaxID=2066070 RepID=Q984C8_RHILO|nr:mlr8058 [Mesorhizobium japonicum MAFF 303099]